jgi:hypothetical protein
MSSHMDILRELSESSATAGSLSAGKGRYSRTPDFAAPTHASTRPKSDRGTTFHFSHKTISKGREISETPGSETSAAAHQGYIERPSAAEKGSENARVFLAEPRLDAAETPPLSKGFVYPGRIVDPDNLSFGTLGNSKAERREFWNLVEANEGRKSRVQNRIIAELPHEIAPEERALVARDFCHSLEERALPYWATIHAPSKRNDSRNYHLHVTYYDRPAGRSLKGQWDFTVLETYRKKSRHKATRRPYRNSKHPDTRDIGWPKRLRRNFADACNFYLSMAGLSKRHDPRSYKDSGVQKEPTEHLGNKLSAMETFGLDTEPGRRNAKREIRFRFRQAELPWVGRYTNLQRAKSDPEGVDESLYNRLIGIASEGITTARKAASYLVAAELIQRRPAIRKSFLEQEVNRLREKDDLSDMADRSTTLTSLDSELSIIESRSDEMLTMATACHQQANKLEVRNQYLIKQFDAGQYSLKALREFEDMTTSGFSPMDDLTIDDPEISDDEVELDTQQMKSIEEVLGELLNEPVTSEKTPVQSDEEVAPGKVTGKEVADEASKPNLPKPSPTKDPIVDIIAGLAEAGADELGTSSQATAADFPESWPLEATTSPEDVARVDTLLKNLDNRTLRMKAVATRDATDLCAPGDLRQDMNRGWVVLRFEAERRGLDLDTGRHNPAAATDADRALLHTDQELLPLRIVRKTISRQMVRG